MVSTITIKEKTGEVKERIRITGELKTREKMTGNLNTTIYHVFPELENIEIIPTKELQTFKAEEYGFEEVMVKGVTSDIDENIKPEFIKEGVNILGVDGGYRGIDTSDATATAEDVLQGKTVYVNNQKIEGTIEKYDGGFEGNINIGKEENAIIDSSLVLTNTATANTSYILNQMITKLPKIDTSKWTTMPYLFYNCSNLIEIPEIDTSNITLMTYAFYNCSKVEKIPKLNTDKVTSLIGTFGKCSSIKEMQELNTSKVTSLSSTFQDCSKIEKIPELDASKVSAIGQTFYGCSNLTTFGGLKNIGKAYTQKSNNYGNYVFDLTYCTKLTYESLMKIINNLYDLNLTYDVANGGTLYVQRFKLGSTNLAKLTAEEIAIATNKGWIVS